MPAQQFHPVQPTPAAMPVAVRWVVFGLSVLIVSIFAVRQAGFEVRQPDTPVVWKKELRFEDGAHGEILVYNTAAQKIATFEGEQGFLRGTLRALARERKKRSISPDAAFELSGHADGQMVLRDPSTGEAIHLASFGPSNAQVYRQLQ